MKIAIDKIDAHPPHAFSPGELRAFLHLLPAELLRDVTLVRLSSANRHTAVSQLASFSRLERRLVIASRGVSRNHAMLDVLRCLVECNLNRPAAYGCGPVALSTAQVESVAQDFLARLLPQMPHPARWSRVYLKYVRGSPMSSA